MSATVLIGGRAYPLDVRGAAWLATRLRDSLPLDPVDDPTEREISNALEHALAEAAAQPIELGWSEVEGVAAALRGYLVAGHAGLEQLYAATRRFRGDPDPWERTQPHPGSP